MLALDFGLEGILLIVSTMALIFLGKSKKALTLKAVGHARFFLLLLLGLILVENGLGIGLDFRRDPDTITLEATTLALTATAIYYSGRARHERPRENLGVATVCTVWVVMANALELILGFFLKG